MQIAAQHAEGQSVRTGQRVKERFLFRRIASQRGDIIDGHAQVATFIEANFADAALAFLNETAMTARVALQRVAGQVLGQLRRAFGGHCV